MNSNQHDVYVEKIAQLSARALEAEERAEEAERERDQLKAARISYANLFDGDVGSIHQKIRSVIRERDELARHVECQDELLKHGPMIMLSKLRAKHWREAADYINGDLGVGWKFETGKMLREHVESIERGE